MTIHGCYNYYSNKYKKAMEIVNIFQENMKNGKETRVIVKNPACVINGKVASLVEITIDDLSPLIIPEIMAKILVFTDDRGFSSTLPMRTEISVYDLELYEEKENTEMKEVKVVTPKRINFRKKNDDYYTDVLWEDGTVTVVKLREGEDFDEYAAFCAALAKKVYGSTNAVNNIVKKTACYPLTKAQKKSIGRMKKTAKEGRNQATLDMLRKVCFFKIFKGISSFDDSAE